MQEVRPDGLEVGKDYYIQLVGRYTNNPHRQSGKAIGKSFIRTITFEQVTREYGWDVNVGIHPNYFNNNDIFVQFREVVPVNTGDDARECGICDFEFHYLYPATRDNFNALTEEEKAEDMGGYQFFEMNKLKLMNRLTERAMNKDRPGIEAQPEMTSGMGVKSNIESLIGRRHGGKKQRKRRRKSRRKSRRRKSRRKNKRTRKRRRRRRRK